MYAVAILAYNLLINGEHPFFDSNTGTFDLQGQLSSNWDFLDKHNQLTE